MSWVTEIRRRLEGELRTPDEIREAAYLLTGDVTAKLTRFWLLLTLSAVIATAGIISDSTATVIGAMIIAPLATPIQGIAVAIAYGEAKPLLHSLGILLMATLVVIGIGVALAALLPELQNPSDNSQITGRISPTLVDLVAAVQGDADLVGRLDPLETVQVIGHLHGSRRHVPAVVVPARPRPPLRREHPAIVVQHDVVGHIGERAEDLLLLGRRVDEQVERVAASARSYWVVRAPRRCRAGHRARQ